MNFAGKEIGFDEPRIMGVLNVTPDSFYDGGKLFQGSKLDLDKVLAKAQLMEAQGATFIDVGGESTRPGADAVTLEEECDRVLPVVEILAKNINAVVSVDTSSPVLMREAARLGAGLLNDVRALSREGAVEAAVDTALPVCFMHMQGTPETMQHKPEYVDAVAQVAAFLRSRSEEFLKAGGRKDKIIFDPGFGFGKTDEHNLDLLKSLSRIAESGYPVLAGLSRKSMIGRLLKRDVEDRLVGSVALAAVAIQNGASIVRVHDVQETADMLKIMKIVWS